MTDRRSYQREVERLLEQIRCRVRELRRLYAAGVRGQALAARKQELARVRARLAEVVGRQSVSASA
jgi:hypothetical protein